MDIRPTAASIMSNVCFASILAVALSYSEVAADCKLSTQSESLLQRHAISEVKQTQFPVGEAGKNIESNPSFRSIAPLRPMNCSMSEKGYWSKARLESGIAGEDIAFISPHGRAWWEQLGFNMAIAQLPASMRASAPTGAVFMSYARQGPSQCEAFGRNMPTQMTASGTYFRIHDHDFRVLAYGIPKFDNNDDMRLLKMNDEMWYSSIYSIAKLELVWTSATTFEALSIDRLPTIGRNQGLFHNSGDVYILDWLDPLVTQRIDSYVDGSSGLPDLHNSMHPLFIPERNAYLLAGHVHLADGVEADGNASPAYWGSLFVLRFYTMSAKAPFEITGRSAPFVFKAADGRDDAEAIQILTSVIRLNASSDVLLISYGVNDCNSVVVESSLSEVFALFGKTSSVMVEGHPSLQAQRHPAIEHSGTQQAQTIRLLLALAVGALCLLL